MTEKIVYMILHFLDKKFKFICKTVYKVCVIIKPINSLHLNL